MRQNRQSISKLIMNRRSLGQDRDTTTNLPRRQTGNKQQIIQCLVFSVPCSKTTNKEQQTTLNNKTTLACKIKKNH